MSRIALVAAMPRELGPIVRSWESASRAGVRLWRKTAADRQWIAGCSGSGFTAVGRTLDELGQEGPLDAVFSLGFAGAIRADFIPGRAYPVATVIDGRTGDRFRTAGPGRGACLLTLGAVAGRDEKARLAAAGPADLIDMEGAAVARWAGARGVRFFCLKGVSDGPGDDFPDFNPFIGPSGNFRWGPFVLFALLRPGEWPSLARLGRNCSKASEALRISVFHALDQVI